jgi:hypothetical protein
VRPSQDGVLRGFHQIAASEKDKTFLNDTWSALGALSAATGTLIVAVAALYAYLQVREAKLARNVETMLTIHQQYQSEELKGIRRRLYTHDLGDLRQLSYGPDQQALDSLLTHMELLAVLVERKILDFKLVATAYPHSIVRVWKEAEPYILNRRQITPYYGVHFERLVHQFAKTGNLDSEWLDRIAQAKGDH